MMRMMQHFDKPRRCRMVMWAAAACAVGIVAATAPVRAADLNYPEESGRYHERYPRQSQVYPGQVYPGQVYPGQVYPVPDDEPIYYGHRRYPPQAYAPQVWADPDD